MKRNYVTFWMAAVLMAALLLSGCSSNGTTRADADESAKSESPGLLGRMFAKSSPVLVPEGTVLVVALDHSLASDQHRSGDGFEATVMSPISVNGKVVIPKGAPARGRVVEARESGRLSGVARLRLELSEVEVDGNWYDVHTSAITRTGGDHKKRNIGLIGGGTAAGAAIGAIAGGGKGAAIGAAAGAGAGTATAAATGKKDITIPAESSLSFKLTQPATINVKG